MGRSHVEKSTAISPSSFSFYLSFTLLGFHTALCKEYRSEEMQHFHLAHPSGARAPRGAHTPTSSNVYSGLVYDQKGHPAPRYIRILLGGICIILARIVGHPSRFVASKLGLAVFMRRTADGITTERERMDSPVTSPHGEVKVVHLSVRVGPQRRLDFDDLDGREGVAVLVCQLAAFFPASARRAWAGSR